MIEFSANEKVNRGRLLRNTAANYGGAVALAAAPVLTLPIYVHNLGELQWALVGFTLTLQALFSVLDAGMSQVLIREFALCLGSGSGHLRAAALLRSCQRLYLWGAVVVPICAVLVAVPLASHWLHLPEGSTYLGVMAVVGAGMLCACYLPGTLYRAVAVAGQHQVSLNIIVGTGAIVRFGGGAVVVSIWPHLSAYLVWHFASLAIEVAARRALAWRVVGVHLPEGERDATLSAVVGGMGIWAVAAVVGAATTQMDKAVLSALMPIEELASYFVASQIALGMLQVFAPVIMAMLPVLLNSEAASGFRSSRQWKLFAVLLALSAAVVGMVLLVGKSVLGFAFGELKASEILPVLIALVVGVCFNALCNVGYINWLARDRRFKLLAANLGALAIVVLVTLWLTPSMGMLGGAYAWSAAQLFVLIMSLDWIKDAYRSS